MRLLQKKSKKIITIRVAEKDKAQILKRILLVLNIFRSEFLQGVQEQEMDSQKSLGE